MSVGLKIAAQAGMAPEDLRPIEDESGLHQLAITENAHVLRRRRRNLLPNPRRVGT